MYNKKTIHTVLVLAILLICGSSFFQEKRIFSTRTINPMSLIDNGRSVTLSNSLVSFTIGKTDARITSITMGNSPNLVGNGGYGYYELNYGIGSQALLYSPKAGTLTYQVTVNTADEIEISEDVNNPSIIPFDLDQRFVLRAGETGLYAYEIYKYPPTMPANANIGQSRYAVRVNPQMFTQYAVDDSRMGTLPSYQAVTAGKKVMDATVQLADGTIYTKYSATQYEYMNSQFGVYGDGYGLAFIKPSEEYICGAPSKQDLTVQQTNTGPILLWQPHSGHDGQPAIKPPYNWQKIYGPIEIEASHASSPGSQWTATKAKAQVEEARWPYSWLSNSLYAGSTRGMVTGILSISDRSSPKNAMVILGAPSPDWQFQNLGYLYFAQAEANGNFAIRAVRPGTYTLYAFVDGEPGQFSKNTITVTANTTNTLGTITWTPEAYGKVLWQIGKPSRAATQFRYGNVYRQWGNWLKYHTDFPHSVNYFVGTSHPSTDWNYMMPMMTTPGDTKTYSYPQDTTPPIWTIHFTLTQPEIGKATLLLGIASTRNATLAVSVNGSSIAKYEQGSFYDDSAMPREAIQGTYEEKPISFSASLFKAGANVITLTPTKQARDVYANIMFSFLTMYLA